MKELYSYEVEIKQTILKKLKEEKKRKNKETGKFEKVEIEVEKEVEETEEYQFCIKSPNTRDRKEAEIFYSIKLNSYIQQGILTHRQIFNKYMDNGGILSNDENEESFKALLALNDVKQELEKAGVDKVGATTDTEAEKLKEELLGKQRDLYDQLYGIEMQKDAIFSNSADTMAKNNLVEWWIINLTHYRKGDSEEYKPFFGGGSFEERFERLCQMQDNEQELFVKGIPTAASVVALWSSSGMDDADKIKEAIEGVPEE